MEMGGQRNTVSDHEKGFGYPKPEKPDGFVTIDMENVIHKDLSSNSRITRSLTRKGYGRSNERKIPYDVIDNDKEISTPKSPLRGSGTPRKMAVLEAAFGPTDDIVTANGITTAAMANGPQLHQITVTNITGQTESRFIERKNSFKRTRVSWIRDPKKVVFFFATLSSIGSIMLILFTLSLSKSSPEDASLH